MDVRRIFFVGIGCALLGAAADAAPRPVHPLPPSKQDCSNCHPGAEGPRSGTLAKGLSGLCLDCHPDRIAPQEHRVDIVPAMPVKDLPLFEGRMTCATCHDPHRNTHGSLLRKPEADLCLSCHPY